MPTRRTTIAALVGSACGPVLARSGRPLVQGVVWQPSESSVSPDGRWNLLGATTLLVQWTHVDGISFVPGIGSKQVPSLPDWARIAARPWAREVILGLAGHFDAHAARANLEALAQVSRRLAGDLRERFATDMRGAHLNVVGWYFPVEVDPTWPDPARMRQALAALPRPLWISVFDNSNIGPDEFSSWVARWLPRDVGVFFQDGVGLYKREPSVALRYFRSLEKVLGASRVRLIAEAFRVDPAPPQFRAAKPDELAPQLRTYVGCPMFLFEGPQYLPDHAVGELVTLLRAALPGS